MRTLVPVPLLTRVLGLALLVAASLLSLPACTSSPPVVPTLLCTPGESSACVGAGGCQGGQVCATDGESFGACECGVGGDAGPDAAQGDSGSVDAETMDGGSIDTGATDAACTSTSCGKSMTCCAVTGRCYNPSCLACCM